LTQTLQASTWQASRTSASLPLNLVLILQGVFSKWEILDCGGKRSATPLWIKIAP